MTTREKLAEMLCQETGALFEAHRLQRNNPIHVHYQDVCSWDAWGTMPAKDGRPMHQTHVYSWDSMGDCVKRGFTLLEHRGDLAYDMEVVAN